MFNIVKQQRQAGGNDSESRRPVGYWAEFNNWWRNRLSGYGCRPSPSELAQWFADNAAVCWRPEEMPSLKEVRTHAKCLRSTEQVRNYFRKYRAARKANSTTTSVRTSGSDSDSEDAAPGESALAMQSGLIGCGGHLDPSSDFKPTQSGAVSLNQAEALGLMPFVFGAAGGASFFFAGAGGALTGLTLQHSTVAADGPAASLPAGTDCRSDVDGQGSSPSRCRPAASACTSQVSMYSHRFGAPAAPTAAPPHQPHHGFAVASSSLGLPPRQPTAAAATRLAGAPLPPAAAAVSGPVISFSHAGQPQHSAHGTGPTRSIGGGIVLRLPPTHCSGATSSRPQNTSNKHTSPAPDEPPAKRQLTAQRAATNYARPAVSGATSSVCLDLSGGAKTAHNHGANAAGGSHAGDDSACHVVVAPVKTGRPTDSLGAAAAAAAAVMRHASLGSCPVTQGSGHYQQLLQQQFPAVHNAANAAQHAATVTAPTSCDVVGMGMGFVPNPNMAAAPAVGLVCGSDPAQTAAAHASGDNHNSSAAVAVAPAAGTGAVAGMGAEAVALSPTQAFFSSWQGNDMDELLMDLPDDLGLTETPALGTGMAAAAATAAAAGSNGPAADGTAATATQLAGMDCAKSAPPTNFMPPPPPVALAAAAGAAHQPEPVIAPQVLAGSSAALGTQVAGGATAPKWWPATSATAPAVSMGTAVAPCAAPAGSHATATAAGPTASADHLVTPTAATVASVLASEQVLERGQKQGAQDKAGEGLSPCSASVLFNILGVGDAAAKKQQEPAPKATLSVATQQLRSQLSQRQQQRSQQLPQQDQQAQSHAPAHTSSVAPEQRAATETAFAAAPPPSCSYPPMYPHAWPYPYHSQHHHHPSDSAAAADPSTASGHKPAMPPPSGAPYPPHMCGPMPGYPYPAHPQAYGPYGPYVPPPPSYSMHPHPSYYYHPHHHMPPPSGYDMYGWSSYSISSHGAMSYPGGPYGVAGGYPGYYHMPPPSSMLPAASGADTAAAATGPPEASSLRTRVASSGARAARRLVGSSQPQDGPTPAEPLMPGRYVWQATTGGATAAASTHRTGAEADCGSPCGASRMKGDGRGGVSRGAARTHSTMQASYCSRGASRAAQSVGAAPSVANTAVAVAAAEDDGVEECVERAQGAARVVASADQVLMPPPPAPHLQQQQQQRQLSACSNAAVTRRPSQANAVPAVEANAAATTDTHGGQSTLAGSPVSGLEVAAPQASEPAAPVLPALQLLQQQAHVSPVADTAANAGAAEAAAEGPAGECGAAEPPPHHLQVPVAPPPAAEDGSRERDVKGAAIAAVGAATVAAPAGAVGGYDDNDLLDLSSITAGLFSPPASVMHAAGSVRTLPGRSTVTTGAVTSGADATPSAAVASAEAAASAFAFTPIHAYTSSRSNPFARPPPSVRTAQRKQHQQQSQLQPPFCGQEQGLFQGPSSVPTSARLPPPATTPRTDGSPLTSTLLASWLSSPASVAAYDVCVRLGLGTLCDDEDASVGCSVPAFYTKGGCMAMEGEKGEREQKQPHEEEDYGVAQLLGPSPPLQGETNAATTPEERPDLTAHIRITYVPPPPQLQQLQQRGAADGGMVGGGAGLPVVVKKEGKEAALDPCMHEWQRYYQAEQQKQPKVSAIAAPAPELGVGVLM